ncbi:MAG: hypothetical protein IIW66_00980, partial [Bacteroidales bacterium]|nr:hypothetical protein [Bacteroidales bacterium]
FKIDGAKVMLWKVLCNVLGARTLWLCVGVARKKSNWKPVLGICCAIDFWAQMGNTAAKYQSCRRI